MYRVLYDQTVTSEYGRVNRRPLPNDDDEEKKALKAGSSIQIMKKKKKKKKKTLLLGGCSISRRRRQCLAVYTSVHHVYATIMSLNSRGNKRTSGPPASIVYRVLYDQTVMKE